MIWVLFFSRPKGDLKVAVMSGSLFYYGSGVCFACRGAITSQGESTDNDIDLLLYQAFWRFVILLTHPEEGGDDRPCTICTLIVAICSVGSEPLSYASKVGSRKFYRIGLSWTSGTKGDWPIELSLSSSFDLTNSFWTSSIRQFISRSWARSSDDVVGPHREFARRFTEGIRKLTGNTPGDHQKKTERSTARMLEATELAGVRT
ncbi:hypothetical protein B296_00005278 [Ensete ventricosum]|uniref:Uncharacterized protein n=1 Tax=Ensete ventricosum TaxID=4639 RepID=A0A427ANG3_ENSVE|nr:hypothetical protein B296_00005278 [Ensete ventricosum]